MTVPAHRGRRDNGLTSTAFLPVADVDPRLGDHLLDVLGLREIPAYVEPAPASSPVVADRLFVDSNLTAEARGVLNQLANELGIEIARNGYNPTRQALGTDLLAGVDLEAEFAAIIAEMPELDEPLSEPPPAVFLIASELNVPMVAAALHDDEVEHFVPPPAPPIPRLTAATAIAVLVTLLGIAVIAVGGLVGLPADLPLPLGVMLILFGSGLLLRRLRPHSDDDPDDGAML